MSTTHVPLLVIGGGIGGLGSALALARAGRTVHLVEQAPAFTEIGAGLQIGPNATRAFDRLGLLAELSDIAVHPRSAVVNDAHTGERLTTLDFGPKFLARYGYPYLVAHRSDILNILLQACKREPLITLENNRTVVNVEESSKYALVTFADGTVYTADIVVGADGIKSRVRQLLDKSEPVFSGHVAHRGAIDIADVATEVNHDDVVLWMGPGIHLMQYPVRRGELYNQVAVYESPRYSAGRDDWGHQDEFDEMFAPACAEVRNAIAKIDMSRAWPVFDRDPLDTWSTEHTVLIGDAAHAMLQYLGQGACQALEDALGLARALGGFPDDPARAFKTYESARIPITSKCQTVARPWGRTWHTDDPALLALRNRVFRMRAADDYSDLDWLYAERPEDVAPLTV
ncbi:FAD-dependent monooxygenase [Rhodococcus rhodochrous]|uniref:FAD-dependent monooxygenase n=1 Tax=Rhodococcus rhodochrous TaxID=1829 RepID=UPI00188CE41B|nr:FAD-dependent monooxygenase [Rhodococcus rhodochrous]MBF4476684.1 FAD-dependent monooxygenase [Rhodococcus rhodochrous]MCD2100451.1 FAD-dependent monooxygenase [Rhodococcus rhodochrous]MCD2124775.1 FAD-dependent monooxygenase [Rhodococcus rhodochrous]MCQ4138133.1 FAD-dependent monooxygenase [Rhodococcus rhodochrous]MDJ0021638.1 FAD-dependent monooxygenase [Rhodococcus rhodochrous]